MKTIFLVSIFFSSVFAVSSPYYQNEYVPIVENGVPVDTPEVQAAKAQHFQAYARAEALAAKRPSDGQYREEYNQNGYTTQAQRTYPKHTLVSFSSAAPNNYNYVPRYTPEVEQARYAHLQYLERSKQYHQYRQKRSLNLIHSHPYIDETPEVQAARAQHFLAHAAAHEIADYSSTSTEKINPYENYYGYHIPLITRKGVPVETSDVQLARQQHQLAHYLAETGNQYDEENDGIHSDFIPIIKSNGVPYDTREVQIEKYKHFLAHQRAAAAIH